MPQFACAVAVAGYGPGGGLAPITFIDSPNDRCNITNCWRHGATSEIKGHYTLYRVCASDGGAKYKPHGRCAALCIDSNRGSGLSQRLSADPFRGGTC